MKNRQNSSDEITHIYVQFSTICDTLIVPSIISRFALTADTVSAVHYKDTDQTTYNLKLINQKKKGKHLRGAEYIMWFVVSLNYIKSLIL